MDYKKFVNKLIEDSDKYSSTEELLKNYPNLLLNSV